MFVLVDNGFGEGILEFLVFLGGNMNSIDIYYGNVDKYDFIVVVSFISSLVDVLNIV